LERGNIDQRLHLAVAAGNGDDRAAIAVADEGDRAVLLVEDALGRGPSSSSPVSGGCTMLTR
jgi:hypothetical protein